MASMKSKFHEQTNIDYTLRLRELLKTLPFIQADYFRNRMILPLFAQG